MLFSVYDLDAAACLLNMASQICITPTGNLLLHRKEDTTQSNILLDSWPSLWDRLGGFMRDQWRTQWKLYWDLLSAWKGIKRIYKICFQRIINSIKWIFGMDYELIWEAILMVLPITEGRRAVYSGSEVELV